MKKLISQGERVNPYVKANEKFKGESFSDVWPIDEPLVEADPMLTIEALQARAESSTKVLEDMLRFEPAFRAVGLRKKLA